MSINIKETIVISIAIICLAFVICFCANRDCEKQEKMAKLGYHYVHQSYVKDNFSEAKGM